MARVMGPLHSDRASGLYGGIGTGLVFSIWRGRPYTRTWSDPEQPRTVLQVSPRARLRGAKGVWDTLNTSQKEYWESYGEMFDLPAWQSFCSYELRQRVQGWGMQLEANSEHLETPDAPIDLDGEVQEGQIIATWTDVAAPYTVGLYLGTSAGFTPSTSLSVYETLSVDGAERQATITVAPGTYYLKARGGGQDGGWGAPSIGVGPLVVP